MYSSISWKIKYKQQEVIFNDFTLSINKQV